MAMSRPEAKCSDTPGLGQSGSAFALKAIHLMCHDVAHGDLFTKAGPIEEFFIEPSLSSPAFASEPAVTLAVCGRSFSRSVGSLALLPFTMVGAASDPNCLSS